MEDQISLLKGAAVEICHIALNTTFCLQTQNFLCGPLRYTIEDAVHGEMVLEQQKASLWYGMWQGEPKAPKPCVSHSRVSGRVFGVALWLP